MKGKRKLNKRMIQSELYGCRFNPAEMGPMQVILDINNATYFENRSVELIKMAQYNESETSYDSTITKAIQLLVVAKILRRQNEERKAGESSTG